MYVRHVCIDLLDAAWGVAMCRIVATCTRVYRVGVWLGVLRFAPLLAIVLSWVDRCFDSWVLLDLFYLLRVTRMHVCAWHYAYTCMALILRVRHSRLRVGACGDYLSSIGMG